MGDRQRKPLYFGAGLDRISGALVVDPTSFQDLRNVHLSRGRVEYRTGHARQLILPAPWTDLLGVYLIRASGLAGAVAFNSVSKTVGLFMIDGSGVTLEYISDMWTMPTSTPPRITAADQYGTRHRARRADLSAPAEHDRLLGARLDRGAAHARSRAHRLARGGQVPGREEASRVHHSHGATAEQVAGRRIAARCCASPCPASRRTSSPSTTSSSARRAIRSSAAAKR
jgi:hypothetical protein